MSRAAAPAVERRRRGNRAEAGTGLISTAFGVVVFILFLLFGVQVLLGLYTTTVVSAATTDAADRLARGPDPMSPPAQQVQSDQALASLGPFARGGRVTFDWTGTSDGEVVLTVHAKKMTLLPPAFGRGLGNRIARTVRVRVERLR